MIVSKLTEKSTGNWAHWAWRSEDSSRSYHEALIDLGQHAIEYQAKQVSFTQYENDDIILECLIIADNLLDTDAMKRWSSLEANKHKKVGLKLMGDWKVKCKGKGYDNCYETIRTIDDPVDQNDPEIYFPLVDKHSSLDEAICEILKAFHSEDCEPHKNQIQETWDLITPDGVNIKLQGNFLPMFDGKIEVVKTQQT